MISAKYVSFDYKAVVVDADNKGANGDIKLINAVKDMNLDVQAGEFVAILGRNGSGKSTFAKLTNALLTPSSGELVVNGFNTCVEANVWNIRQNAGMVFQNPDNQIIATIVEDDIAFGPENLGVPTEEIRKRVDNALSLVNMSEYALHSPHFLSGGQKQRVCIAGALAMHPNLLILDEPTAMLDPIGRKEVLAAVSGLNKNSGITVLLITHYMEEAVLADKVFVMDEGAVVMQGTPREVFSHPQKLRALGLDVPQVTEIAERLAAHGVPIKTDIITINEMVEELCRLKNSK
ncbi:MAG: energy-coupling factor transporter ATPase [Defluviitaleaceae bacterium]|nr:energy-coupling factor transporter ATPase [Defluviitaleaceae bacterium]